MSEIDFALDDARRAIVSARALAELHLALPDDPDDRPRTKLLASFLRVVEDALKQGTTMYRTLDLGGSRLPEVALEV